MHVLAGMVLLRSTVKLRKPESRSKTKMG